MTKTRAAGLARVARRYGYFRFEGNLGVTCPECRQKVVTQSCLGETVIKQLDRAMVTHLMDGCE